MSEDKVKKLADFLRYWSIRSTSQAGSGHPTSCLSAVEIVSVLFGNGFFRFDLENPENLYNDRLIFSKGHAAPLLYSLWAAAGAINHQDLLQLRQKQSPLEGHPTFRFPLAQIATGSLGQGLSAACGMAVGLQKMIQINPPYVFVLLGDSELAEGQIWEAFLWAGKNKINNLIALIDQNRLGQRGETIWGADALKLAGQISSFGWRVYTLEDGHDINLINSTYQKIFKEQSEQPTAVVFKTKKGKGIPEIEDKNGWHGKPLPEDKLQEILKTFEKNKDFKITLPLPQRSALPLKQDLFNKIPPKSTPLFYFSEKTATRQIYGKTLNFVFDSNLCNLVVLDAEVSNSTFAQDFAKAHPERFLEMYIAEQNMISVACGLSRLKITPFVSSFAAFLTRAFDQIRMAQYSKANFKIIGTHAGVAIGADGASQMGLEDLAMFRSILESVIFYPADAVSAVKLLIESIKYDGIVYLRLTRNKTPIIYKPQDKFSLDEGFKIHLPQSSPDLLIIAAGITLHESLKAARALNKKGIKTAVVDLYVVKPVNENLKKFLSSASAVLVVEDHYKFGGLYSAVCESFGSSKIFQIAVEKLPHSASEEENLRMHRLDAESIIEKSLEILKTQD